MKLAPPPGPRRWVAVAALVLLAGHGAKEIERAWRHPIEIDAGDTLAPIPRLVYGQLLEHVGRSLDGGLLAEMLADRKFFFPVDGNGPGWGMIRPSRSQFDGAGVPFEALVRSPWQVLGPREAITMDATAPYVGQHAVRVSLGAAGEARGIAHPRLTLVSGRVYEARVVLAGDATAAPIEVSLVWGPDAADRRSVTVPAIGPDYTEHAWKLTAGANAADARFEIVGRGTGAFRVGLTSLVPEGHDRGMRRDVLALVRRMAPTILRWPGGDFVSGYDFRDGLGPRDRRPPRKNPAWPGIESNDFGMHEYMDLCARIGAEPYVVVNTGRAGEELAALEVEYANGAATTPMGRLRATHGRHAPWGVRWWGIGNEMWAAWQLGRMPVEKYALKHKRVVDAMRRVDRSLRVVTVGEIGEWDETMLAHVADHTDMISAHVYAAEYDDVKAHATRLSEELERYLDAHRRYRREIAALRGKDIRVAVDEWSYWHGAYVYGPLGVRHTWKDALGVAVTLHAFFRNADIVGMAEWTQVVNALGCIKTSPTDAVLSVACWPLVLYRHHFGETPVEVDHVPRGLHVAAAWTADRRALTVAVVNLEARPRPFRFDVSGTDVRDEGTLYRIQADDPMHFDEPGTPPKVAIKKQHARGLSGPLDAPRYSISLYVLPVR